MPKVKTGWWHILKPLSRQMRHEPPPAEQHLWQHLRNRGLFNVKFRRQHAIERFIVDFYCAEAHLIIEVDGSIHEYSAEHDALRQAYLESLGLHMLRFNNDDVLKAAADVLKRIEEALQGLP